MIPNVHFVNTFTRKILWKKVKDQSLKLFYKHIVSNRWEFSRGLLLLNSEQIHEVLKGICKAKKGLRLNVIPYDLVNDECDITRIRDAFRNNLPKLNL